VSPEPEDRLPDPVVLVIRADPSRHRTGRAALRALRALLKRTLREHGWRVVEIRDLWPTPYYWTPGEGV
jgi:hypothetical protein